MQSRFATIGLLLAAANVFAAESYDSVNAEATRLFRAGDYPRATALAEEAMAISEKETGPSSLQTGKALNNVAALYHQQEQSTRAVPLYQRSIAILEKELGEEHAAVAIGLNNLAMLYKNLGQYDDAAPLYRRSLLMREKLLGPDHLDVAVSLNNLAELYRARGETAEAKPLYERSLAIIDKTLGNDHSIAIAFRKNLAAMHAYKDERPARLAQLESKGLPAGMPIARSQEGLQPGNFQPLSAASLTLGAVNAANATRTPASTPAPAPTLAALPAAAETKAVASAGEAGSALDALIASSSDWVQRTPGGHYFIQLWADEARYRETAEYKLGEALALLAPEQVRAFRSALSGRDRIGIIYGDFAGRASATAALAQLPPTLRKSRPTLRPVHQLRDDRQAEAGAAPSSASLSAARDNAAATQQAARAAEGGNTLDSLIAASAEWIKEAPGQHYFIQLWSNDARYRAAAEARLGDVLAALDPQQVRAYRSNLSGRERIGIIYGDYPDRAAAAAAAMAQLPAVLGKLSPYVRTVARLR